MVFAIPEGYIGRQAPTAHRAEAELLGVDVCKGYGTAVVVLSKVGELESYL